MKLRELHPDVERYLEEDCYCPNEVYSVDGFGYMLVYADAECELLGKYTYYKEPVLLVATYAENTPILLNIFLNTDNRYVTGMERYDLTEHNISEIKDLLTGKKNTIHLSEHDRLLKDTQRLLSLSDAVMID